MNLNFLARNYINDVSDHGFSCFHGQQYHLLNYNHIMSFLIQCSHSHRLQNQYYLYYFNFLFYHKTHSSIMALQVLKSCCFNFNLMRNWLQKQNSFQLMNLSNLRVYYYPKKSQALYSCSFPLGCNKFLNLEKLHLRVRQIHQNLLSSLYE